MVELVTRLGPIALRSPLIAASGTVGSVVNHVGFIIKNLAEALPKWQAAALTIQPGTNPNQMFVMGPEGVMSTTEIPE